VRGENYGGTRLLGRGRENVVAGAFNRKLLGFESQLSELALQEIADWAFISRDRFNIDELARERDEIHAYEDNAEEWVFSTMVRAAASLGPLAKARLPHQGH
jgi:hypothetical protein